MCSCCFLHEAQRVLLKLKWCLLSDCAALTRGQQLPAFSSLLFCSTQTVRVLQAGGEEEELLSLVMTDASLTV